MVNVTHNNNDRSSFNALTIIIGIVDKTFFDSNDNLLFDLCAKFFGNEGSCIKVDDLIDSTHFAKTHKLLDNFGSSYLKS